MKKLLLSGVISLAFVLLLGAPLQLSASSSSPEEEAVPMASKRVTHTEYLPSHSFPKSTYYFSQGGWTGTLTLDSYQSTGEMTIAYYSGTVYCSGSCVINGNSDDK